MPTILLLSQNQTLLLKSNLRDELFQRLCFLYCLNRDGDAVSFQLTHELIPLRQSRPLATADTQRVKPGHYCPKVITSWWHNGLSHHGSALMDTNPQLGR